MAGGEVELPGIKKIIGMGRVRYDEGQTRSEELILDDAVNLNILLRSQRQTLGTE